MVLMDTNPTFLVVFHIRPLPSGGALAGAMLWSAAHNDSDDQDGCVFDSGVKYPQYIFVPLTTYEIYRRKDYFLSHPHSDTISR